MNVKELQLFAGIFNKVYVWDFLELMLHYHSISASEAASRLNLHIKTAQDFLDACTEAGIAGRKEVNEGKRPYFRYSIIKKQWKINVNLRELGKTMLNANTRIREKQNNSILFNAPSGNTISYISIIQGRGRGVKEKRIHLTAAQGAFLFHMPFPNEDYSSIEAIMNKAEIKSMYTAEIKDIVEYLIEQHAIEQYR